MKRSTDSHTSAALAVALLLAGAVVALPTTAAADLYKYRRDDGSVLITTERRADLELLEVISGGDDSSASTSSSTNKSSGAEQDQEDKERVRRARERRREHKKAAARKASASSSGSEQRPRRNRFDDIIREASEAYEVPFSFVKAVVRVESDFTADAVSHAGAMGLMQLMPQTADYLNVTNPFDPRQNVFGGTKLLRILIDRYDGDINLILSAYNAGDAAVDEYDGIPYRKTRQYVASVYHWYKHYNRAADGEGKE